MMLLSPRLSSCLPLFDHRHLWSNASLLSAAVSRVAPCAFGDWNRPHATHILSACYGLASLRSSAVAHHMRKAHVTPTLHTRFVHCRRLRNEGGDSFRWVAPCQRTATNPHSRIFVCIRLVTIPPSSLTASRVVCVPRCSLREPRIGDRLPHLKIPDARKNPPVLCKVCMKWCMHERMVVDGSGATPSCALQTLMVPRLPHFFPKHALALQADAVLLMHRTTRLVMRGTLMPSCRE